jgi:hypothetical protein
MGRHIVLTILLSGAVIVADNLSGGGMFSEVI